MTYSNNDLRVRKGFKPRKESMRDAWARKMAARGFPKKKAVSTLPKCQKPAGGHSVRIYGSKGLNKSKLRQHSKTREKEMRLYYKERKEWLSLPANAACRICLCLDRSPAPATEVHHQRGRIGRLLRDQRFWIPSCRGCREVPHENPAWAREVGLLAEVADWNVYPR